MSFYGYTRLYLDIDRLVNKFIGPYSTPSIGRYEIFRNFHFVTENWLGGANSTR